jgi:hypothetical protein
MVGLLGPRNNSTTQVLLLLFVLLLTFCIIGGGTLALRRHSWGSEVIFSYSVRVSDVSSLEFRSIFFNFIDTAISLRKQIENSLYQVLLSVLGNSVAVGIGSATTRV